MKNTPSKIDKVIAKFLKADDVNKQEKFKKKLLKLIPATGRIIKRWEHCRWGDSINFFDEKGTNYVNRLTGHMRPKPCVGDEMYVKMQSGKTATYLITSTEYCGNPNDMFFCDCVSLGYVEER